MSLIGQIERLVSAYDNNWFRFFESWIVNMFFGLTAISLSWPLVSKLMQRKAKKAEQ